jgi:hypothetical protein
MVFFSLFAVDKSKKYIPFFQNIEIFLIRIKIRIRNLKQKRIFEIKSSLFPSIQKQ